MLNLEECNKLPLQVTEAFNEISKTQSGEDRKTEEWDLLAATHLQQVTEAAPDNQCQGWHDTYMSIYLSISLVSDARKRPSRGWPCQKCFHLSLSKHSLLATLIPTTLSAIRGF